MTLYMKQCNSLVPSNHYWGSLMHWHAWTGVEGGSMDGDPWMGLRWRLSGGVLLAGWGDLRAPPGLVMGALDWRVRLYGSS
jgi:hypothetical protein